MKMIVNSKPLELDLPTHATPSLEVVLQALGYVDMVVATAVNKMFVPVNARTTHILQEGDQLEILAPMQGG